MPKEAEQTCDTCMYERGGECHRHPPLLTITYKARDGDMDPETLQETNWPRVSAIYGSTKWCGEWAQPALVLDNGAT